MHNQAMQSKDVTLLEVLDRVLEKGVVVAGDAVISVADVDLIYVGLRVLLSSVETMERLRSGGGQCIVDAKRQRGNQNTKNGRKDLSTDGH